MQKYKRKSPLAYASDKLLRALAALALGLAWFIWLWGLSAASLCAGAALGGLIGLCMRLFGQKSVVRREAQMRRAIGGELALNRLLLMKPRHAAFQTALWVQPKIALTMRRAVEWGVVGTLEGKPVLLRVIAQHESVPVGVQQVIDVLREARGHQAERCVLCLTAPLTREGSVYAESAEPPLTILPREELLRLAGRMSPATDDDLRKIGRSRRTRRTLREWASVALEPTRARRYCIYGAALALMAFLTGEWVYPIPAVICLTLYAACKFRQARARV